MKKILAALLVLALVAPAMAAGTITFGTPVTTVAGQVTIPWTATEAVVGLSLKVNVTAGTASSVVVNPTSFFDVFVDSAFTQSTGYVYKTGIPTASQTAAGELVLPQSVFSICVGGLDDDGAGTADVAPVSGSIVIQGTAGAAVAITADTLRGGIVSLTGAMTVATLPINTNFGAVTECVKSTAPFYADWVAFGKPNCWCYSRNCRGDINGTGVGTSPGKKWITTTDLTAFKLAFNIANSALPAGGVCADLNHAGVPATYSPTQKRVTTTDLTTFKLYFNKAENDPVNPVTICPMDNYNFWTN